MKGIVMFVAPSLWRRWAPSAVLAFTASLIATDVTAHARWSPDGTTPGRNNNANIKVGPCGVARTNTPAVFKTGETITLQWESTIHHQGYFRIAFSPAGDAGFDQNVLLDNVQEFDNRYTGEYSAQVTLPNEPCDDCTLQMIQVMLDRSPPTNYYSCADIQLVADTTSDSTRPAPVSNFEEERAVPDLRVRWINPEEDFAGVVVVHVMSRDLIVFPVLSDALMPGAAYQQGDEIGYGRVVYVGSAQALDLPAVSPLDELHVYAFDMAYNYSAAASLSVKHQPFIVPPAVTLVHEQTGQPSTLVYAADGPLIVQANVTAGEANGDIFTQWSVGPRLQTFDTEQAFQVTLDPVNYAGEDVALEVVVTDSIDPPNVRTRSLDFRIHPGSYYNFRLELMQRGEVVSAINADNGPAEARITFTGETPANVAGWTTSWQHDIPNAVEEPMVLRFTPTASANYSVSAQVSTPTAQAGPEQTLAVAVNKPVKLGAFGGLAGAVLPLLLLVPLWFRRRARLQGAA